MPEAAVLEHCRCAHQGQAQTSTSNEDPDSVIAMEDNARMWLGNNICANFWEKPVVVAYSIWRLGMNSARSTIAASCTYNRGITEVS
mmetsp:Transcript_7452/g.23051  ORF Transcript_7452/g.23051 Transcript_7452/m.23051 type:complete len:87 (-) Transcript_7452:305-565(-)